MPDCSGTVDFRDDHFVVSCPFEGRVHAALQALPKQQYDSGVWLVPRHARSVAGLMAVARQQQWQLTRYAAQALSEIRERAEQAEFYLQLVRGPVDQPWFKCRADDPELEEALSTAPGAERDDELNTWIIPATTREACEHIRAIIEQEPRFNVDAAAQRLLDEPEQWPELSRPEVEEAPPAPAAAQLLLSSEPKTLPEVAAAFEREQELLAWSRAVIADTEGGALERQLRPYQRAGVRYLLTARRAFLADDKGLGKSVQALAAIEASAAYPALIVCVAAVELQWEREIARWLPAARTCSVVDGSGGRLPDSDVVIVQYELLHRMGDELRARKFRAIVADDSSQLRNERSLKTRAALAIAETVSDLRFCLSTSVLFDQPIHLLPQLLFLGRVDALQGRNAFVERYCRPRHDVSGTKYGASHVEELEQRLRACCLCRRDWSQVAAQLPSPPRYHHMVRSDADAAQRTHEGALLARLRSLHEREAAATASEDRAACGREVRTCLAELLEFTAACKVDGIAEWIDHFLLSGEWLAVMVRQGAMARALERRYAEAVFVSANGTCSRAGVIVNPFFVADSRLLFIEDGAHGPALRLARGRHVAMAELGGSEASRAVSELLLETRAGERGGAEWQLVSDMALDRAYMHLAEERRSAHAALSDAALDPVLHELLRDERCPELHAMPGGVGRSRS